VIFAEMSEIDAGTSGNFVRTSARARRRLSYEQTGRRLELIRATSVAIAGISAETLVTDEATCATSGEIAGRRGTINQHGGSSPTEDGDSSPTVREGSAVAATSRRAAKDQRD